MVIDLEFLSSPRNGFKPSVCVLVLGLVAPSRKRRCTSRSFFRARPIPGHIARKLLSSNDLLLGSRLCLGLFFALRENVTSQSQWSKILEWIECLDSDS